MSIQTILVLHLVYEKHNPASPWKEYIGPSPVPFLLLPACLPALCSLVRGPVAISRAVPYPI